MKNDWNSHVRLNGWRIAQAVECSSAILKPIVLFDKKEDMLNILGFLTQSQVDKKYAIGHDLRVWPPSHVFVREKCQEWWAAYKFLSVTWSGFGCASNCFRDVFFFKTRRLHLYFLSSQWGFRSLNVLSNHINHSHYQHHFFPCRAFLVHHNQMHHPENHQESHAVHRPFRLDRPLAPPDLQGM